MRSSPPNSNVEDCGCVRQAGIDGTRASAFAVGDFSDKSQVAEPPCLEVLSRLAVHRWVPSLTIGKSLLVSGDGKISHL